MIIKIECYFPKDEVQQFATANLQDSKGNWENRVISLSSLSRNIGEDKSYEISGMSIELNDSDRLFRTMMSGESRYISGKLVKLLDVNDNVIYTGNVEKWEFRESTFTLFINDLLSGLDTVIPPTLTKELFNEMAEEGDGSSIPIIYGQLSAGTGALKCWRVTDKKFLLADHPCLNLDAAYDKDGKLLSSSEWKLIKENIAALGHEVAMIEYTGTDNLQETAYINVNVQGKVEDSQLMEHPIDVLEDIIDNYAGMSLSTQGLEANRLIMDDRSYKLAAVINNQETLKDLLVHFAFSFDCDFHLSKDNQVVLSLLDWGGLESKKSFDPTQIISYELQELPEEIRNRVTYKYSYNYADSKYQLSPLYEKKQSIENWGEFYNKNEALSFQYIDHQETAFDVVQRYTFQRSNPLRRATIEVPLQEFNGTSPETRLDITDIIGISHPGAIDENERKYQIRRVEIDFNTDSVRMECLDINSLTGGIFILGDESMPDTWEETDDYSRQFAYLCGADGLFGNGLDEGKILY